MMSRVYSIVLYCLVALLLVNCSSDDEGNAGMPATGELILNAIIGEWTATSALFTTTNASPEQSRDVVDDGGFCDLTVAQNHSFVLVIRNPGVPDPQLTTGEFIAAGNLINVRFDSAPNVLVSWDFTLSGDNLTIEGPLDYDFESDGALEEVTAVMQFVPN